jgi:hypothetical protein
MSRPGTARRRSSLMLSPESLSGACGRQVFDDSGNLCTVRTANRGPTWLDQRQAAATPAYPGHAPVGLPSRTLLGVGV